MTVIVDTPIWSLALRRPRMKLSKLEAAMVADLHDLVREGRALLLGSIRQEILSGIRAEIQFAEVARALRALESQAMEIEDYETAARFSNSCRSRG